MPLFKDTDDGGGRVGSNLVWSRCDVGDGAGGNYKHAGSGAPADLFKITILLSWEKELYA